MRIEGDKNKRAASHELPVPREQVLCDQIDLDNGRDGPKGSRANTTVIVAVPQGRLTKRESQSATRTLTELGG